MRTLTITKLFRPLRWQTQFVPFLRLSGKWLAAAGFQPGGKVIVSIVDGALVVRPWTQEVAR